MQELSSAKEEYTPEFDLTGVKSSAECWVQSAELLDLGSASY
jgi:hypothetical protein